MICKSYQNHTYFLSLEVQEVVKVHNVKTWFVNTVSSIYLLEIYYDNKKVKAEIFLNN